MTSPKVRSEISANTRNRGEQAKSPELSEAGARIIEALADQERSRTWLARESGLPESTIGDAVKRGPARTEVATRIAGTLGVSLDWLVTGQGGEAPMREPTSRSVDPDDETVEIEEINLAYGLGGSFVDDEIEKQVHRFPQAWLEKITRTPPSMLFFASGRGDSMTPTISDGDMVMIDRSQRAVREQDAMWALTVGEIAMIKRVRVHGDRVELLSDNDRVPAYDAVQEELNVVGRVIFVGRRI